jgi:hypothetical protein
LRQHAQVLTRRPGMGGASDIFGVSMLAVESQLTPNLDTFAADAAYRFEAVIERRVKLARRLRKVRGCRTQIACAPGQPVEQRHADFARHGHILSRPAEP